MTNRFRIAQAMASMYAQCSTNAEYTSEYLFGETVLLADEHCSSPNVPANNNTHPDSNPDSNPGANSEARLDWVHVRAERDDYTGYMQRTDLQAAPTEQWQPTHWVAQRSTLVFTEPSIKSAVLYRLPFLSKLCVEAQHKQSFIALQTGGYIWATHVLTCDQFIKKNALQLAQTHFLGAPYLWGGCSPDGVDCSGLIQALALAKGIRLPRDSGDQENFLEHTITRQTRQSGDLVYWPGHVGILVDSDTVLHATAHSLSCTQEPLIDVEARAGKLRSIKRLF